MILATIVTTGEESDGPSLQERMENSNGTGIEGETFLADTAYSGKTLYVIPVQYE